MFRMYRASSIHENVKLGYLSSMRNGVREMGSATLFWTIGILRLEFEYPHFSQLFGESNHCYLL
jgi:hypothetical protein